MEDSGVCDMDLDSVAKFARPFARCRREMGGAPADPVEFFSPEFFCERVCVQVRVSYELEGIGGSTSFGECGPFDKAGSCIDEGGEGRGNVRGRWNPGNIAIGKSEVAFPSDARDDRELAVDVASLLQIAGVFSDGECVSGGNAGGSDEGNAIFFQADAFQPGSTEGIGTVEDYNGQARFHRVLEGCEEGVESAADVLDVEGECVQVFQGARGGPFLFAVEAENGNVQSRILHAVEKLHSGGNVATDAVFGGEERGQSSLFVEELGGALEDAVDSRMVRDEADAFPCKDAKRLFSLD